MAISYSVLRAAAARPITETAKSISEADRRGRKTAFLCHSHLDRNLAEGFVHLVKQKGWDVYIDWKDTSLPSQPNRTTAAKIKQKIKTCDLFIFLATKNSVASRWCPWEIGYGDGVKFGTNLLVVPTKDDSGNFHGNEYLQLYRKLDVAKDGRFAAWRPDEATGIYASQL